MAQPSRDVPRWRRRSWILGGLAVFIVVLGLLWERCGIAGCPNV